MGHATCVGPAVFPLSTLMLWGNERPIGELAYFPFSNFETTVNKIDPLDIVSTTLLGALALA